MCNCFEQKIPKNQPQPYPTFIIFFVTKHKLQQGKVSKALKNKKKRV